MSLGIYISVPFCRTKCSFCNFASDVFLKAVFDSYVNRVCADIAKAEQTAAEMGGQFERAVNSVYVGGGTPTVLEAAQLERIFAAVHCHFDVAKNAEVTVECAPGTLIDSTVESLLRCGVNRVSLGVQSFVDQEAAVVGRLHKRTTVLEDISRLRAAGISNLNVDLIAGLPHQTADSWNYSVAETIATQAPHASVYMLEVDEESRLGSELIAGGARYHAHFVPDEEAVADFYLAACETFAAAGIAQYEISNFARASHESRHNLKYWTRQPYVGFGVDAHSMLLANREGHGAAHSSDVEAVRFAQPDSLERYVQGGDPCRTLVSWNEAIEESFFLGLRLNRGICFSHLRERFGDATIAHAHRVIAEMIESGLMEKSGNSVALTAQGRLLSNEVFARFLLEDCSTHEAEPSRLIS